MSRKRRSSLQILVLVVSVLASLAWAATASASLPPSIDSESATDITQNDATLNAEINPQGQYTAYEFQIDTDAGYDFTRPACPLAVPGYARCAAIIVGEPLPAGLVEPQPASIPAAWGDQGVSLDLADIGATLQPGTTYHYRVIASNGGNQVEGPDQMFTTTGGGVQPVGGNQPVGGGQSSRAPLLPSPTTASPPVDASSALVLLSPISLIHHKTHRKAKGRKHRGK